MSEAKPKLAEPYEDKATLEKLYVEAGLSAGQIAKKFNVSRGVILRQLKKHGIQIVTRKQPKPGAKQDYKDMSWLKNMLDSGKSISEIAKEQGISYSSCRYHVQRLQASQAQKSPIKHDQTIKTKTNSVEKKA